MVPEHLRLLFTHSNQDLPSLEEGEYIHVTAPAFFTDKSHTQVTTTVEGPVEARAVEIKYENFLAPMKASSPVPVWSRFSIYAKIPLSLYRMRSSLRDIDNEQTYKIVFEHQPDNPRFKTPIHPETKEYEYYFDRPFEYKLKATPNAKETYKLQTAFGHASLLTNLEVDAHGDVLINDIPDSPDYISRSRLPDIEGGWLPNIAIDSSMEQTNPEVIAYGLFMAISYEDVYLVLSIVKEFVRQAKLREWFYYDRPQGKFILNSEAVWGLEYYLDQRGVYTTRGLKEVYSNALLGTAICAGLSFIQDRIPLNELPLYGKRGVFIEEILISLKALSYFCAYSISPTTGWASYKEQLGRYSYEAPCHKASYQIDIFLHLYLGLDYDEFIHRISARLHSTILEAPNDLSHPLYYEFVDRNYTDPLNKYEPRFLVDPSTSSEAIRLYSMLSSLASKALWYMYFPERASLIYTLEQYEDIRAELIVLNPGFPLYLPDHIILWVYRILDIKRSQFFFGESIGTYTPHDISLYLYNGDLYIPAWAENALASYIDELENVQRPLSYLPILSLVRCYLSSYNPVPYALFDTKGIEAAAMTNSTLQELRRMMPYGGRWFSEAAVNSINSVIGSMLYAEANLYFDWALGLIKSESSLSYTTAMSDDLYKWAELTFACPVPLAQEGFLRDKISRYFKRPDVALSTFMQFLTEFMGVEPTLIYPDLPYFCALIELNKPDAICNYTDAVYKYEGTLTLEQHYAIAYKYVDGDWVSREVPGFPIKHPAYIEDGLENFILPEGYSVYTIEQFKANPIDNVLVEDGPVLIYPLSNYLPRLDIDIKDKLPHQYDKFLQETIPVGLQYSTYTTYSSTGEEIWTQ